MTTMEAIVQGDYRARIVVDADPIKPDWDEPSDEEMRAWSNGEVYGIVVERYTRWVRYVPDEPTVIEEKHDWDEVDSCWGFYGWEHTLSSAHEMLAYAATEGN